ncbi:MAG: hypothetical protein KKG75_04600 [Nanoarchaeota archaeon]|nr:hypothetical protein [Nanoarchaeota archaeon]
MVFKTISRFLGKTLISLSLTIFILTFFAVPLIENVDVFKESLTESFSEGILLEEIAEQSDLSVQEIKNLCNKNPEQEGCEIVTDPPSIIEEEIAPVIEQIEESKQHIFSARVVTIFTFLLGLIFLYLGTFNIILTAYKASITTLFISLFYALFYGTINRTIPSLAEQAMIGPEVPKSLLKITVDAINKWFQVPSQQVLQLCIILIAISLPLTIIFYFLKRRTQLKIDTNTKAVKKPKKK